MPILVGNAHAAWWLAACTFQTWQLAREINKNDQFIVNNYVTFQAFYYYYYFIMLLLGYLQGGETPLYYAAIMGKAEVAKVLISAGATLTTKIRVRPSRHQSTPRITFMEDAPGHD